MVSLAKEIGEKVNEAAHAQTTHTHATLTHTHTHTHTHGG